MTDNINNIKKEIQDYLEVRVSLIKMDAAESVSKIAKNTANMAVIGYLVLFILLFLSFAAGYYLGSLLNSTELGFLCVGGFYLLILVLYLLFKKQLVEKPVIKGMVKAFFGEHVRLKTTDQSRHSDITSMDGFRTEKQRLTLEQSLIETRLQSSYQDMKRIISFSNLLLNLGKEYLLPKISDLLDAWISKLRKEKNKETQ